MLSYCPQYCYSPTERGLDSDFTIALLMSAMSRRTDLKLILMSATISTDKFASYLGAGLSQPPTLALPSPSDRSSSTPSSVSPPFAVHYDTGSEHGMSDISVRPGIRPFVRPSAPVMFIPGYTFPVTEFYKNEFEEILRGHIDLYAYRSHDPVPQGDGGQKTDPLGCRIGGQKRPGDIDYDLLIRLIVRLATGEKLKSGKKEYEDKNNGGKGEIFLAATGAILIFLPGVPEINKTIRLLESVWGDMNLPANAVKLKILPL